MAKVASRRIDVSQDGLMEINASAATNRSKISELNGSTQAAMISDKKTGLRPFVVCVMLASPAVIPVHHANGQDMGDAVEGHRLADRWCSSCHVVNPSEERGTSSGAPTFSAIAAMKSTTPLGLRVFLQTPHSRMPDLHLTRDEVDNLIAYIESLRQP